jgi:glycosyltransferase involved in cell wall biosynthesis
MNFSKKRILISANSTWNLFNFRAKLISEFIKAGHEVIAVAPEDKYTSKLLAIGCQYIPIPMATKSINPIKDLFLLFRYIKIFFLVKPSIYLSFTIKPNIYGSIAAHLLNIPAVNNISGLGTVFIKNEWLVVLVRWLYKIALFRSAFVFFQNKEDRRLFVRHNLVKLSRSIVLPGSGIDLEYFFKVELPRSEAPFRFLLIARMLWDKGIGEFIEAAKILKNCAPNTEFWLLGDFEFDSPSGIELSQLKEWASEGIVQYFEKTDDVRWFIARANCVVLPSYREGLSRSLLEAASMGRPIVTTNVPGCRDVVDIGINGYICHAKDSRDLAKKMLKIRKLPRNKLKKMADSSREKAIAEFDIQIILLNYLKIINLKSKN